MDGLILHSGAKVATRDFLRALPVPKVLGPIHRPTPHIEFVERIERSLDAKGLVIEREQFGTDRDGLRLFGVLGVTPRRCPTGPDEREMGWTLGLRTSNDRSIAHGLLAGRRVFVCDNMAFSGDSIILSRKHTTGIFLDREIDRGIARFIERQEGISTRIEVMRSRDLTEEQASRVIVAAFDRKVLPLRLVKPVIDNFFHTTDDQPECRGRTAWSLHNSFTRAFRGLPMTAQMRYSERLGALFGITEAGKAHVEILN